MASTKSNNGHRDEGPFLESLQDTTAPAVVSGTECRPTLG